MTKDNDTRSFEDVRDEVTADETDVWLTPHDMDHLQDGQPVFKQGDKSALVLRTRGWDGEPTESNVTPTVIDGHRVTVRSDGPAELMADIVAALADVKQERENNG